jgi:hypothetical protein
MAFTANPKRHTLSDCSFQMVSRGSPRGSRRLWTKYSFFSILRAGCGQLIAICMFSTSKPRARSNSRLKRSLARSPATPPRQVRVRSPARAPPRCLLLGYRTCKGCLVIACLLGWSRVWLRCSLESQAVRTGRMHTRPRAVLPNESKLLLQLYLGILVLPSTIELEGGQNRNSYNMAPNKRVQSRTHVWQHVEIRFDAKPK